MLDDLQHGDKHSHHNSFNFFSGFQEDVEFGRTVNFLDADFDADYLISIPLDLGHLNMTMLLVSFLLSVGDAGVGRSAGRIAYFDYT
jgi:hypothetical protein